MAYPLCLKKSESCLWCPHAEVGNTAKRHSLPTCSCSTCAQFQKRGRAPSTCQSAHLKEGLAPHAYSKLAIHSNSRAIEYDAVLHKAASLDGNKITTFTQHWTALLVYLPPCQSLGFTFGYIASGLRSSSPEAVHLRAVLLRTVCLLR